MSGEEQHVWNMIDYVERQVEHGMKIGTDLQEVANMLAGAKMMLEAGLVEEAANMTDQALEVANATLQHYKILVTTIKNGRRMIDQIADGGGVVDESIQLMILAEEALERSELKEGMNYAVQCMNCLGKPSPAADAEKPEVPKPEEKDHVV